MLFTGGCKTLTDADDTKGQQDADRDGDHADPGRQARHLLQDRDGRQGGHDRYRGKKYRGRVGSQTANGYIETGYAQHAGNQSLISTLEQDFGSGATARLLSSHNHQIGI